MFRRFSHRPETKHSIASESIRDDSQKLLPQFTASEQGELDQFAAKISAELVSTTHDFFDAEQTHGSLQHLCELTDYSAGLRRLIESISPGSHVGPYRVIRFIARGGMGAVFEAEHTSLQRRCALKIISREDGAFTSLARFRREMRTVAMLNHPHIVTIHDAGEMEDYCYFAMELLNGLTLTELVEQRGPLPPGAAATIAFHIAQGLVELHGLGLVHRDVKPSNVILAEVRSGDRTTTAAGPRFVVKLLDLGLVKPVPDAQENGAQANGVDAFTEAGTIVGSVDYMGSEQASGVSEPHPCWDFQSLGMTLWFLVTGKAPLAERSGLIAKLAALSTGIEKEVDECAPIPSECRRTIKQLLQANESFDSSNLLGLLEKQASKSCLDEWLSEESRRDPNERVEKSAFRDRRTSLPTWRKAGFRWITAIAAMALIALGYYWITAFGQIVIESTGDQVAVSVSQNQVPILESVVIGDGKRTIRLRAGEYQVQVVGDDAGDFVIDDNRIVVQRNSVQSIRIRRRNLPAESSVKGAGAGIEVEDVEPLDNRVTALRSLIRLGAEIFIVGVDEPLDESVSQVHRIRSVRLGCGNVAFSTLLKYFAEMPPVEDLRLNDLNMSQTQFQEFIRLPAFTRIRRMTIERSTMADPGDLCVLQSLEGVEFYRTRLAPSGFANLAKLKGLTHLSLADTGASNDVVRAIEGTNLSNVWLYANPSLTDSGVIALVNPGVIQLLNLNDTSVGDEVLAGLQTAPKLWALNLSGTRVSDTGLASIADLPRLSLLSLSRTTVSASGLENLENLPLTHFWIDECPQLGDLAAASIARMHGLKVLSIARAKLTSAGIARLAELPDLEELSLPGVKLDESAVDSLSNMVDLRLLTVWDCGLSDSQITRLKDKLVDCRVVTR